MVVVAVNFSQVLSVLGVLQKKTITFRCHLKMDQVHCHNLSLEAMLLKQILLLKMKNLLKVLVCHLCRHLTPWLKILQRKLTQSSLSIIEKQRSINWERVVSLGSQSASKRIVEKKRTCLSIKDHLDTQKWEIIMNLEEISIRDIGLKKRKEKSNTCNVCIFQLNLIILLMSGRQMKRTLVVTQVYKIRKKLKLCL